MVISHCSVPHHAMPFNVCCSVPHHAMPFRGWNCLGIEESQDGNGILNTRAKLKSLRLVDLTAARAQIRKEMRADYRPGRLNLGLKGPRFRPEPGASLIRKFCFPLSYVFFLVCFFLCFFFVFFFVFFLCVFFCLYRAFNLIWHENNLHCEKTVQKII